MLHATRILPLVFALLCGILAGFADTIPADTLLNASSAKQLHIINTSRRTALKVTSIDSTDNNFYYETSSEDSDATAALLDLIQPDVKQVLVLESPTGISVSYIDS